MFSYKQKIQKELKKAMEKFEKQNSRPFKTHLIQKSQKQQNSKLKNKKLFRPVYNHYQKDLVQSHKEGNQLCNFYNIFTVDEAALHQPHAQSSYIKNIFYTKTTRKIEIRDNYLVFQLTDNFALTGSVTQTIQRYRRCSDEKLKTISFLMEGLQAKLGFAGIEGSSDVSITQDAYRLFDSLGKTLFISKIAGQKLVISKSLIQLCQWDINQFILQSLINKIPSIEGPRCTNYFEILSKQIQNYSKIIDFLQGTIPLTTLVQFSKMNYIDYITTRNNIEYQCVMNLSMPIPLVELITIDQIINSQPSLHHIDDHMKQQLKRSRGEFLKKSHSALQYLIDLPQNRLPSNENRVVGYIEKSPTLPKIQESYLQKAVSNDSQSSKGQITYQF